MAGNLGNNNIKSEHLARRWYLVHVQQEPYFKYFHSLQSERYTSLLKFHFGTRVASNSTRFVFSGPLFCKKMNGVQTPANMNRPLPPVSLTGTPRKRRPEEWSVACGNGGNFAKGIHFSNQCESLNRSAVSILRCVIFLWFKLLIADPVPLLQ